MCRMLIRTFLTLMLVPAAVRAETVTAHYAAYAAGLNVIAMDAVFELTPAQYRVQLDYRTTGTFGVFVRSQQSTIVQGAFVAGRAEPRRFASSGLLRGEQRVTEIDTGRVSRS